MYTRSQLSHSISEMIAMTIESGQNILSVGMPQNPYVIYNMRKGQDFEIEQIQKTADATGLYVKPPLDSKFEYFGPPKRPQIHNTVENLLEQIPTRVLPQVYLEAHRQYQKRMESLAKTMIGSRPNTKAHVVAMVGDRRI